MHAIAGLLKLYLRELPTSILTSDRRDDFVKVTEMEDASKKVAVAAEASALSRTKAIVEVPLHPERIFAGIRAGTWKIPGREC